MGRYRSKVIRGLFSDLFKTFSVQSDAPSNNVGGSDREALLRTDRQENAVAKNGATQASEQTPLSGNRSSSQSTDNSCLSDDRINIKSKIIAEIEAEQLILAKKASLESYKKETLGSENPEESKEVEAREIEEQHQRDIKRGRVIGLDPNRIKRSASNRSIH